MKCDRCGGFLIQGDEALEKKCVNCGKRFMPQEDGSSIKDKLTPKEKEWLATNQLPPTPPQHSPWDIPDIAIRCVKLHGRGHCRGVQVPGTLYCPVHQPKRRQPPPKPPQPPRVKPMPPTKIIPSGISFLVGPTVQDWEDFIKVWRDSHSDYAIERVSRKDAGLKVDMFPVSTA